MNTRFVPLLTATALMFSLPACAASSDVDLLSYDQATSAPVPALAEPDAAPVTLTPPVVMETEAPAPEKKAKPAPAKVKKAAPPKPAAQKPPAPKLVPPKPAAPVTPKAAKKPAAPKPLLLKAGDVIRMDVKDEPDLSGSFPISADGKIKLPLLGEKPAAEMTLIELKNAITAAYKDGYLIDPKISLSKEVSP